MLEKNENLDNWNLVKKNTDTFFTQNEEYAKFEIGAYFKSAVGIDIKHIVFTLSRYKFVSRLVAHRSNLRILELGCNEAWGSILLLQNNDLKEYVGLDFDEDAIEWNRKYLPKDFEFIFGNVFEHKEIKKSHFNLIFSSDMIEHLEKSREDEYFEIIYNNLSDDGVGVVGTPSRNMSPYASEDSKVAHINLYDQNDLYNLASKYFSNVFIFNMNDEIVNTSFDPMSCYIFAVCCGKKEKL